MGATQGIREKLAETIGFIRERYQGRPRAGLVLGSGLGNLTAQMDVQVEIPYSQLPHFPVATVEGHSGRLVFGSLNGTEIVVMSGRFHCYEGYSPAEVAYPVRVLKGLGIEALLIANAAGGVQEGLKVGDLMVITDHISLFTLNPLTGDNDRELGPRFPDMSEPYARHLIEKAKRVALRLNRELKEGVYFGVQGPSFETRAEYKMIRTLGGDAVGMSTIQEVIAAVHAGIPVFAMSVIANLGIREEDNTVSHREVLEQAADAEPALTEIFKGLLGEL